MHVAKLLCILVALAQLLPLALTAAGVVKPIKVYIFAGQSNMEGADAHPELIDSYPLFKGSGTPQTNVLFTSLPSQGQGAFEGWGPLQPRHSFGSELTFARLLKQRDKSPLAIIKSAVGGTTLAYDWNPAAPAKGQKLYPRTLQLIQESLHDLEKRGLSYRLEGVMWHQGENDMLDKNLNTHYASGLDQLIRQLRKDLHAPALKWFIAEVSEKGIWGMDNRQNLAVLRQQQDEVLKADPLLHWVPTSHLAFEVMQSGQPHYHFGTQGQLQMGEAFARAYLQSLGQKPIETAVPLKNRLLKPKTRVRLFVLAGQRTMEGEDTSVADISKSPDFNHLISPQKNVLFRYSLGGRVKVSQTWEPLGPVDFLGNFGPELSFGALLRKSLNTKEGLALVKFTHSGAQGPDWFPSGSPEARRDLYPHFISFIRAALEDLNRQGYEPSLEGIVWHTGENDTYFGPYQRKNATWMKALITQVRLDLQQPLLPWFISEQHPAALWRNMESVNADLRTMAQTEQNIVLIKTDSLPFNRPHFGTQGTLLLGEAMAKAYLQRQ